MYLSVVVSGSKVLTAVIASELPALAISFQMDCCPQLSGPTPPPSPANGTAIRSATPLIGVNSTRRNVPSTSELGGMPSDSFRPGPRRQTLADLAGQRLDTLWTDPHGPSRWFSGISSVYAN